ncbi:MAG: hypothetical protein ABJC13_04135 [Acidobacteriota bacterium]
MKTIRAVAFRSGDWWVAQCLEYRIATQSRRLEDLPYELDRLLKVQIAASLEMGIEPFYGFSPAPRKYWEMYEKATSRVEPVRKREQEGPQFETRIAA